MGFYEITGGFQRLLEVSSHCAARRCRGFEIQPLQPQPLKYRLRLPGIGGLSGTAEGFTGLIKGSTESAEGSLGVCTEGLNFGTNVVTASLVSALKRSKIVGNGHPIDRYTV